LLNDKTKTMVREKEEKSIDEKKT